MSDSEVEQSAENPRIRLIKALIAAGADPDQRDVFGQTAMHQAALNGDMEIVECLMSLGASMMAADKFGHTPLAILCNPWAIPEKIQRSVFGLLSRISQEIWLKLKAANEFSMTYGEETVTDELCLALLIANVTGIRVHKVSKYQEGKTGVDVELYVGSDSAGWWTYLIQAKRLNTAIERYKSLWQTRDSDDKHQFELLEEHAVARKAIPLYAFYNFTPNASIPLHYHCKLPTDLIGLLGWTVVSSAKLRPFLVTEKKLSFDDIHKWPDTLPARCILCSRIATAKQASDHPLAGDFNGAIRIGKLPAYARSQAMLDDAQGYTVGKWIVVVDTSSEFLAPCQSDIQPINGTDE